MDINLETLFVTLAFILPGFLVTRLVSARSPATPESQTVFHETLESLLRSVFLNVIAFPITFLFLQESLFGADALNEVRSHGIEWLLQNKPFESEYLFFLALIASLIIALLTGIFWDPLDAIYKRLNTQVGKKDEDPVIRVVNELIRVRSEGQVNAQVWVQARLKNGNIYQGQLAHLSFADQDNSRELLLDQAVFYPEKLPGDYSPQTKGYVLINTRDLDSIEMVLN